MRKNPLIYLNDILLSIKLIEDYINGVAFEIFEDDYGIQDKVLRRLEIIAEAAKKLPDDVRLSHPDVPWKSIIGLRNIITHTYDEVNLNEVWEIITNNIPHTKKQIEEMKADLEKNFPG